MPLITEALRLMRRLRNWKNNFQKQIDYFMDKMILACEEVEKATLTCCRLRFISVHRRLVWKKGMDVTAGGAKYNLSGIQMIQVANLADSLAAVKQMVYDDKKIEPEETASCIKDKF